MEEQLLDATSWVKITKENHSLEHTKDRGWMSGPHLREQIYILYVGSDGLHGNPLHAPFQHYYHLLPGQGPFEKGDQGQEDKGKNYTPETWAVSFLELSGVGGVHSVSLFEANTKRKMEPWGSAVPQR